MKNNFIIAARYAVLISLLMLLWISLEYMVGLHDKLADFYPFVAPLSVVILVFGCHRAYREKLREKASAVTFRELFVPGLLLMVFAAILAIPVQFIFHELINADFFQTMIDNAGLKAMAMNEDKEQVKQVFARLFNLPMFMFLFSSVTFVVGTAIALLLAWQMNTAKD